MTTPARPAPLACSPSQVGLCARCRMPCHRYGAGGNPLCATCREAVEVARGKKAP